MSPKVKGIYYGGWTGKQEEYLEGETFDAVLVDLLMPAKTTTGLYDDQKYLSNVEMPVGLFLALMAAYNGTKYVVVLSNANHHSHPNIDCLNHFSNSKNERSYDAIPLKINDSIVLMTNSHRWTDYFLPDDLSVPAESDGLNQPKESISVKYWKGVLDYMECGDFPIKKA